jgi:two-component system invasion response regulator UvrY
VTNAPIRVLLIDDHPVVLAGYRRLIEAAPDLVVVAEAHTGEEGYFAYFEQRPDVVVLDLALPGRSGLDTLQRIIKRDPGARVLIVSIYDNEAFVRRARDAGAKGYLSKRSAPPVLLESLRRVAGGQSFFDTVDADEAAHKHSLGSLSPREFEVFRLLAEGHTVLQISQTLSISPKTAGVHQTRIMNKLDLDNAAQLTRLAIRHGIIQP